MHINSIFKLIALLTLPRERPGGYITPLIYEERAADNSSAVLFVPPRKWRKLGARASLPGVPVLVTGAAAQGSFWPCWRPSESQGPRIFPHRFIGED